MLRPFARGNAGKVFKYFAEIIYIRKTAHIGDLFNSKKSGYKQSFCVLYTAMHDISVWGGQKVSPE